MTIKILFHSIFVLQNYLLMFGKREKKEKIKLSKESYAKAKSFLKYMKPYGITYTIGWVFLVFSSVTAMIFPLLMGQLLGNENGMGSNTVSLDLPNVGIKGIFILLVVVLAGQAVFSFFRVLLFSIVTEKTLKDIKIH